MKKLADLLLQRSLLFIVLIFTLSIVGVYTFLTIDQLGAICGTAGVALQW